jgi:hypothetical protein
MSEGTATTGPQTPQVDPTDKAAAAVTTDIANGVETVSGLVVPATLRDELHKLLTEVEDKVKKFFGAHLDKGNPAKVEQLLAHSATVHMVIDDLHDTTPPAPPTA